MPQSPDLSSEQQLLIFEDKHLHRTMVRASSHTSATTTSEETMSSSYSSREHAAAHPLHIYDQSRWNDQERWANNDTPYHRGHLDAPPPMTMLLLTAQPMRRQWEDGEGGPNHTPRSRLDSSEDFDLCSNSFSSWDRFSNGSSSHDRFDISGSSHQRSLLRSGGTQDAMPPRIPRRCSDFSDDDDDDMSQGSFASFGSFSSTVSSSHSLDTLPNEDEDDEDNNAGLIDRALELSSPDEEAPASSACSDEVSPTILVATAPNASVVSKVAATASKAIAVPKNLSKTAKAISVPATVKSKPKQTPNATAPPKPKPAIQSKSAKMVDTIPTLPRRQSTDEDEEYIRSKPRRSSSSPLLSRVKRTPGGGNKQQQQQQQQPRLLPRNVSRRNSSGSLRPSTTSSLPPAIPRRTKDTGLTVNSKKGIAARRRRKAESAQRRGSISDSLQSILEED